MAWFEIVKYTQIHRELGIPYTGKPVNTRPFDVDQEMLGAFSQLKQPIQSYWNDLHGWVKEALKRIEGITAVEDVAALPELGGRQLQLNDEWKQRVETLVRNMNSDDSLKPTFMTSQRKQRAIQYLREKEGDVREMLNIVNSVNWNDIESVEDVKELFSGKETGWLGDFLDEIYLERDAESDMEFDADNLASLIKVIEQTGEPISEMPPREDLEKRLGQIASALKQNRRTERRYQAERDFTDEAGRPTDIWGEKEQSLEGKTEVSNVGGSIPEEGTLEWWKYIHDQAYPEDA